MATCQSFRFEEADFAAEFFRQQGEGGPPDGVTPSGDASVIARFNPEGRCCAAAVVALAQRQRGVGPRLRLLKFAAVEGDQWDRAIDLVLSAVLAHAVRFRCVDVVVDEGALSQRALGYLDARGLVPLGPSSGSFVLSLDVESHSYGAINRLAYDVLADEYEQRSRSPGASQEAPAKFVDALLSTLTVPPIRALELGPGSGDTLLALSGAFETVVGVELSDRMAGLASARAPTALVIRADILNIDFASSYFDAIFAGAFLHLFPATDAELLVRRMVRWLRPGGRAFINTTADSNLAGGFEPKSDYLDEVVRYRARWTEVAFRQMLEDNGFRIISRMTTDESERQKFWIGYVCGADGRGS